MSADTSILHPTVFAALAASNIRYEAVPCRPELADTAEFCANYGVPPEDACNTILVAMKTTPRKYVACLVRSDMKLDVNHRVATEVGFKRLSFASSEEAAELSGQMIGGVSVAGLPADIPILVDARHGPDIRDHRRRKPFEQGAARILRSDEAAQREGGGHRRSAVTLLLPVLQFATLHQLIHLGSDLRGDRLQRRDRFGEAPPHRGGRGVVGGRRVGAGDGALIETRTAQWRFAMEDSGRVSAVCAVHDSMTCTLEITNGLQSRVNFSISRRDNV